MGVRNTRPEWRKEHFYKLQQQQGRQRTDGSLASLHDTDWRIEEEGGGHFARAENVMSSSRFLCVAPNPGLNSINQHKRQIDSRAGVNCV